MGPVMRWGCHVPRAARGAEKVNSGSSSTGSGSYGNKNGYVVRVLDQRLSNSLHESLVTLKCLLSTQVSRDCARCFYL